jgi:hypothetical protein
MPYSVYIKPQTEQTTQPSIIPASLRQEEDLSTILLSLDPLLSNDNGSKTAEKDIAL